MFAYIDAASGVAAGTPAGFNIFDLESGDYCLTFYRHMHGSDIGRLYLSNTQNFQPFYEVTGGTSTLGLCYFRIDDVISKTT